DLYYSGPTNRGNPLLKPEKASTLEGGMKFNLESLRGHLVVFSRKGTNLIDWIKTDDEEIWTSMNHTSIRSKGVEVNLVYIPVNDNCVLLPDKIEAGYVYNKQEKEESPFISYYVMDNLRHKIVASA